MSFYGNVTYYLSNAFANIEYANGDALNTEDAPSDKSNLYTFHPRSRSDTTRMIAYNKWIMFGGDTNLADNMQVYIFHSITGYGEVDLNVGQLKQGAQESIEITGESFELANGDAFSIPLISFDAAGHLKSSAMKWATLNINVPNLSDIQEIKLRIAAIEASINGSPSTPPGGDDWGIDPDTGEPTINIPDSSETVMRRLERLETKTSKWIMDSMSPAGNPSLAEDKSLGETMHDLLVLLGTRIKSDTKIYLDNVEYDGYEEVIPENVTNTDTILGKVKYAYSVAGSVSDQNARMKEGILSLGDFLCNTYFPGTETRILSEEDWNSIRGRFISTV